MNSKIVTLFALFAILFGCALCNVEQVEASSSIKLHVFGSSSIWWFAVDPRNELYETAEIEYRESSSSWATMMPNPSWGYWQAPSTTGSGFDLPLYIRLTATNGAQVNVVLNSILPGQLVDTRAQYPSSATQAPTEKPTTKPTVRPTETPTHPPTQAPTERPTQAPTERPTQAPTERPTQTPTERPTTRPTSAPTTAPTTRPTSAPTTAPTTRPTSAPTTAPTTRPTSAPTTAPTTRPTSAPTTTPTTRPTLAPTTAPTTRPTSAPTAPTTRPTAAPTTRPTTAPTTRPTTAPTTRPTTPPTTDLCSIVPTSSEPIKILVPLYVYPGAAWDQLVTAAKAGVKIIAIINPNSGPSPSGPDSSYVTYMKKLTDAGVEMVGYVHTLWGDRSLTDVTNEINTYASRYTGVTGIFLDEASAESSDITYYRSVYNAIMAKSGYKHAILNPGVQPDQGYLDISTNIVIYENYASSLASARYSSWIQCAPNAAAKANYKYKFSGIVHTATLANVPSYISQLHNAGMGLVYITDGAGGCCTYNTLASYFTQEATSVVSLN